MTLCAPDASTRIPQAPRLRLQPRPLPRPGQRSACAPVRAMARPADVRGLSLTEAHKIFMDKSMPVIDVRSVREFRSETLSGAVSAPLLTIPSEWPLGFIDPALSAVWDDEEKMPPFNASFEAQVKTILRDDRTQAALILCSTGSLRAREAANLLDSVGFEKCYWVVGGLTEWLKAYSPKGVVRKRVIKGAYVDDGPNMCGGRGGGAMGCSTCSPQAAGERWRLKASRRSASVVAVCSAQAEHSASLSHPHLC